MIFRKIKATILKNTPNAARMMIHVPRPRSYWYFWYVSTPPYLALPSNSFLKIASVEYLIGERYCSHLSHTYTSFRLTKYPAKRMNGSIINDVNDVAAEEFVTAVPIKNPNEVAQKTSRIRIATKMKNLSASAVNPTAK